MAALTRRAALAGIAAALAAPHIRMAAAAQIPELILWGPSAGPSVTLVHAIASGALAPIAGRVEFKAWRSPDELRAGLTSGTMQAFILPTQTAANLFNRGLGVRLLNVMTNGLLHVASGDASLASIAALKGRSIAVPYRNDTPDLLFRRLLAANRLSPDADVELQFTGTPMEAVQYVLTGRTDAALLPEPAMTAALLRAREAGRPLFRAIDLQKAWDAATGLGAALPQAGLGVTEAFLDAHASALEPLQAALAAAAASVNADPARAAADSAPLLGLPAPVIERAIPHSNLVAIRAGTARPALEGMFQALAEFDPKIIGGRLPAAEFYL